MADPFMGQIMQVGFSFAPAGWVLANGQTMAISQFNALFALVGTYFGGNGVQTFQVPNLSGRVAIGTGQSPGTSSYVIGQISGTESVTLTQTQMPMHTHPATFTPSGGSAVTGSLQAKSGVAPGSLSNTPTAGAFLANTDDPAVGATINIYAPASAGTPVNLGGLSVSGGGGGGAVALGVAGGSQPFSVLQPYLAMTTIFCVSGIFPSRS